VTTAADLPAYGLPSTLTSDLPLDLFAGSVDVTVWAAGGLEVDAQFVDGHFTVQGVRQSVFFLAIDAELPVGVPLFLGLDLCGLSGLSASDLQPDPAAQGDTWWQWYKYPAGPQGIDTSGTPDYSATNFEKWLTPAPGKSLVRRRCSGPHQAARRQKLKFFLPNEPWCLPPSSDPHTGPSDVLVMAADPGAGTRRPAALDGIKPAVFIVFISWLLYSFRHCPCGNWGTCCCPGICATIRAMKAHRHDKVRQLVRRALARGPAECRCMTARSSGATEYGTVWIAYRSA
jgi:hypothetical protein